MRRSLLLLAAALLAAPVSAQTFTPTVVFSVHDEPVDGLGDTFNATPFEGLIRTQSSRADRALQEFDVTALAGQPIGSAMLSGRVDVNNAFNNGVRTFDFLLYAGNGLADLTDYEVAATLVGTGQYQPPVTSSFTYAFDVTATVRTLIASGATHVGLRVAGTSNPSFPNILSASTSRLDIGGLQGLGTQYCGPAVPNSTGVSARITAAGSAVAASNDLVLTASTLPGSAFGFFLTSRSQGLVVGPGGSQGDLCLASPIGRYVGPGQIQNSGAAGAFALTLDLTATPTPTGFVTVAPGETWNFQAWFRDAVGGAATSNFTDGVSVVFQ